MRRIAASAQRTVGMRFEVTHRNPLGQGPIVVIARHASYGDAILPALVLGAWEGFHLRYVLMRGLRWEPALDLYGSRLPNHFVERVSEDPTAELAAIHRLTVGLDEFSAAVIFPEGRFFSPARHDRAVAELHRDRPELVQRATALRSVLPPRPGGFLACWARPPMQMSW